MSLRFIYAIDTDNYLFDVRKLIKVALRSLDKIFYVSLNKTAKSIRRFCEENFIDQNKIVIMDMVTPRFKNPTPEAGVVYFNISDDITTLVNKIVVGIEKYKCSAVLIDSLSTFELYFDTKVVNKIVHDLLVYTESEQVITLLLVQKMDTEKDWIKSLIPLVDELKEVKFDQKKL